MTINDEIIAIANQLANDGQQPTIAKIKTKLKHKVPLPKIITVLKTWQHDPDFTEVDNGGNSDDEPSEEVANIDEKIESATAPLLNEIGELKTQIQSLKSELDAVRKHLK